MNKKRRELVQFLYNSVTVDLLTKQETRPISSVPGLAVHNEGGTRELMIYGRIGGGSWYEQGIGATDVVAALRELGPGPVDVRINSGGGDVFDGVAIHSLLARHNGTVTMYIDGLAASAASFIAMAGDRVVMARNAFMMIHDGMTMTYGNGATHRGSADLLDKISDTIADMYAERAGEDVEHWRNLMTTNGEDGTWFTGREALDAGLVDDLTGGEEVEDRTRRNLQGWRDLLPSPVAEEIPEEEESSAEEASEDGESSEEQQDIEEGEHLLAQANEREWAWMATALAAGQS